LGAVIRGRRGQSPAQESIALLKGEADNAGGRSEPALKRTLTASSLIALGIGCIIGAGIFVLTGNAAATNAGPAVALSFIISGVVCAFAGLCYAEMASTVPIAGSAYTYAYATLGELIAWIIGWDLILEYAFGATAVAIGWSGYVVSFLHDIGVPITGRFASSPSPTIPSPASGRVPARSSTCRPCSSSPRFPACSLSARATRRVSTTSSS
jgi:APA family basic amino acid/polyamine antiporter